MIKYGYSNEICDPEESEGDEQLRIINKALYLEIPSVIGMQNACAEKPSSSEVTVVFSVFRHDHPLSEFA